MNRGPLSDGLFGSHFAGRRNPGHFAEHRFDHGHVGRTTDENHLVQLALRHPRLLHHQLGRVTGPLHQVAGQPLEVTTGQGDRQALALVVDADRHLGLAGKIPLGLFTLLREGHQRFGIFARIFAELLMELLGNVVDDAAAPVQPAKHHVTVRRQHAEVGRRVTHDGHVERSTPQVVHQNRPFLAGQVLASQLSLLPGVGQRRGGRLVDDVDDIQTSDLAGILRRLPADIVEVVGNGNHRIGDRTDFLLCILLELLQDECRDEFRRELLLLIDNKEVLVAHLPLDGFDDVGRIFDRHPFEGRPDDHLPVVAEKHDRRRNRLSISILQRRRMPLVVELGNR